MVQERSEQCPTALRAIKREQTWRCFRYTKGTLSGSSIGVGKVITLMMFPLRPFLGFFCFEIGVDKNLNALNVLKKRSTYSKLLLWLQGKYIQ